MLYAPQILTDYHMHSTFSTDGHDSPLELCQQALALGLKEIAITEHAEWHPAYERKGLRDAAGYFAAIEQCRAQYGRLGLRVYAGIELGNPHLYQAEVGALLGEYPFEVRLGSLHWLYGEDIHNARCFDGRDADQLYTDYFIELGRMVQLGFREDRVNKLVQQLFLLGVVLNRPGHNFPSYMSSCLF